MSIDSIISSAIKSAVTILATDGLKYRNGPAGTWVDLVAKFHAGPTEVVGYDEAHNAITQPLTAHIKVPAGGTVLTVAPAGEEWQVQEADLTEWAVVGSSRHLGQTIYQLRRVIALSYGQQRGEVAQ